MIKKENVARYPGLAMNAKIISEYFPMTKIHVEPFSGLARTAKFARAPKIVLNDMSEYANSICKKQHPGAIITHQDFADCIKKWDGPDTFFLIDPPWFLDYYKDETAINKLTNNTKGEVTSGNIGGGTLYSAIERINKKKKKGLRTKNHTRLTMFHGKGETPAFIDRTVQKYLSDLMRILDKVKAHYIVTLSPQNKFYAPFRKDVRNPRKMLFGGHPTNSLYSNHPLKIRIPQLTKYF